MGNAKEKENSVLLRSSDAELNEHRPPEPNMSYELNETKLQIIFSMIKTVMENTKNSFYGFQVTPDGLDAIITFKTDMFTTECFDEILPEISELIIIPIDTLFAVQFRVSGAVDILSSDLL